MKLSNLEIKKLKQLSKKEVIKLLKNEWEIAINNYHEYNGKVAMMHKMKKNDKIKNLTNILEGYFLKYNTNSTIEVFDFNTSYTAKSNVEVFKMCKINSKKKFIYYLKLLYINKFLHNIDVIDALNIDKNQDINFSSNEKNIFPSLPFLHNLEWIFSEYEDLFDPEILCSEKEEFILENNGLELFDKHDSHKDVYNKIKKYGSIVKIVCSLESKLYITNKGMNLVNSNLFIKNQKLVKELEETKFEQENIKNKIELMHDNLKDEVKKHKTKIHSFYKDIITILSILVATFSVIGVNLNVIPNINNNLIGKVLLINLSLIFVISSMFFIIKKLVFNLSEKKDDHLWIILFSSCILSIGLLYIGINYI